jgi:protein gp37
MAEDSKIEWTDHTFNPWIGCQKVGPGCDNCYAEAGDARFNGGVAKHWGPGAPRRRTAQANWNKPRSWARKAAAFAAAHGRRQRVFCASWADVFDNAVDPQWRADLFDLIRATPELDWLLLTKRIGNVADMLPPDWGDGWPNVWLGATVVNQAEADRDIPKLLRTPAALRFLSVEPMLGMIDLTAIRRTGADGFMRPLDGRFNRIDWVICGGESGAGARPMHPDWARSLRDQCAAAGTPFFFKQWGEWFPGGEEDGYFLGDIDIDPEIEWRIPDRRFALHRFAAPPTVTAARVGKKTAGRVLDGQAHDGFPESPAEGAP